MSCSKVAAAQAMAKKPFALTATEAANLRKVGVPPELSEAEPVFLVAENKYLPFA